MQFKVVGLEGVRREVVRRVRGLVVLLDQISPCCHDLEVIVVPGQVISDDEGGRGFARFDSNGGSPIIHIAGEKIDDIEKEDWLGDMLPTTVAHEWAHYEQFRDFKAISERGISVRTRNLARQAFHK